ncbi:MAG: GumC family protein [Gammaproteobacteria bacterium]
MSQSIPLKESHQIVLEDDEIDLREYLYIISKYKWSILGLTFTLTLLTTLIVFSIEPTYRATATVLIESQEENVVSIEEVYGLPGSNREYFETQHKILESRDLAEKVIDKLNIPKHPEFDPSVEHTGFNLNPKNWLPGDWFQEEKSESPTEHDIRNAIFENFIGRLNISPIRNSQLITISFDAHDPELAAKVPNTLAEVYIDSDLEARLAMTQKAASWITERLDGLKQKVVKSEQALQAFRDKEKLVDVKGVGTLAAKELDKITEELVEARRARAEAEALYRQVEDLQGQPIEAFASIPAVLKDIQVHNAREARAESSRKVSEIAKRYGPKHPKMIAAKAELATANENVRIQIRNVLNSVSKEYEVARARESQLTHAMDLARAKATHINRKQYELSALQREVDSNRQLHDMFITRFKETNATEDLQSTNARIIDPAVVSSEPAKPKKLLIIVIALFLSLTGGTVLAFLIESLDNTMKDSSDVERKLHLPVLGILPKLSIWRDRDFKVLRYYSDHIETNFAENIRTIRTGILLTAMDKKQKTVLVTSSLPNEGKSVVAVNLAMAMARMDRVLLIDADMRRPSILNVFAMKSRNPGLSHYIAGTNILEECFHYFEQENLYVMPAGIVPPNPLEMLSSDRFIKAIESLKSSFDHIVFDSAPTIAVSDVMVISQCINSIIYVVKADATPYQLALEGIKRLRHVDAHIAGVVLNQMTPSKRPGRYGYAYGDYYNYHGYGYTGTET